MSTREEGGKFELEGAPALIPEAYDPVGMLDSPTAGGKVIRGSLFRLTGYVAGILLGVVSASLMIRHLGPVDWGRYVAVISLVTIVSGLSEAGLGSIGVREYATREGPDRDRLMRNLLGLRLTITFLGVAAAVAFALAVGYARVAVFGTILAGTGLLISVAQQMYTVPLGIALRLGWVSALDFIRQFVTVVFVVGLVAAGAGLFPFLAAAVPVSILMAALTVALMRGAMPLLPLFERSQWAAVARLTIAYSASAAVATIYVSLTVVITSLLASGKELGYYGASFRIFSVLAALPVLLVNTAFPILARAAKYDEERLKYAMQRLFESAVIFGSWLAIATALGARFAIHVVAGSGFHRSIGVLQIQGAALLATFLTVTWGTGLLAVHRHKTLLVSNLVGLATSAVLAILLVPGHGAKGAAFATLGGESVLAVAYTVALFGADRRLRVEIAVVFKTAAAAGAALALALIPHLAGIALVLAATGVYFAVLWILRGIPEEFADAIIHRRRRGTP